MNFNPGSEQQKSGPTRVMCTIEHMNVGGPASHILGFECRHIRGWTGQLWG